MMGHFKEAMDRPSDLFFVAKMINPDDLAKWCREYNCGFAAVASIVARGYWTMINGHWYRNEEIRA